MGRIIDNRTVGKVYVIYAFSGMLDVDELSEVIIFHYENHHDLIPIWDYSAAGISALNNADLEKLSKVSSRLSDKTEKSHVFIVSKAELSEAIFKLFVIKAENNQSSKYYHLTSSIDAAIEEIKALKQ